MFQQAKHFQMPAMCLPEWYARQNEWSFQKFAPTCEVSGMWWHIHYTNTLARHRYTHGELTKVCRDCDKKFAFAHELKIHRFGHKWHPAFKCAYPDCDKAFFREGELTKHAKIHKKIIWKCEHCDYESYDECNLKGHMALHSKTKNHVCSFCTAHFTFYMQLLRHGEKRHKLGTYPILKQKTWTLMVVT